MTDKNETYNSPSLCERLRKLMLAPQMLRSERRIFPIAAKVSREIKRAFRESFAPHFSAIIFHMLKVSGQVRNPQKEAPHGKLTAGMRWKGEGQGAAPSSGGAMEGHLWKKVRHRIKKVHKNALNKDIQKVVRAGGPGGVGSIRSVW